MTSSSHESLFFTGGGTELDDSGACTPVVCKVRPALIQACAAYNDGSSLGSGSITVHADVGTDVALHWSATNQIATFAFRGTQTTEVSLQGLNLYGCKLSRLLQ